MSTEKIQEVIERERNISNTIDPLSIPDGDPQLQLKCNLYIHQLIKEWETTSDPPYLPERLPEVKRNLLPLLVQLRKSTLPTNLLTTLASILYHLQQSEYDNANQRYMDLSIGNASWPIGVASVGIHSSSNTSTALGAARANVMKDKTTKDWILQIKRLITFSAAFDNAESSSEDDQS
ncbi:HDL475Cp [Eremothecium sinecaudum]|uniref:Pre-mRNA-splicing factor 18 n=1 Tax=Eremothecium sinecaudum TaxID=45286 RepID=A0A0X8HRS6_9SACH|nr:HDL475Cp [Eremothecium sinecaudum]AMD20269.1 HDL475Cp [Eremothecium sinecaudum]